VVAAWVVGLVAAYGAAGLAGDWSADYSTPGSESRAAAQLLQERFPERNPETVDVVWQAPRADAAGIAQRIDRLATEADALEGIGRVAPAAGAEISRDGTIGVLRIPLTELVGAVPRESGERLIELAEQANGAGLRVELGGQLIANAQDGEISSEMVGMAIAALVLLLTFGSIVAAGLPLATALFGLGISGALIGLLAAVLDVPDWAPALASMLGIGVGIDYALLIVTRYRGALAAGREPRAAVVESIATAGRSVLIAGTTVVISLVGLFLMGLPYLYGAALATIVSVLIVMAASVTLVPALMAIAGRRIDRLRIPGTGRAPRDPDATQAARWGRGVQRRPWLAAIAGVAVLLVLASPFAGLRLGFPDRGNDAADTTTRQAYELVSQGFGPGANGHCCSPLRSPATATTPRWARSPSDSRTSPGSPR
jgi:putative drug exporter of the RND superfamily